MRYHALACDYDGTLATDGSVDEATWRALGRLRASGRKIILVTGRRLEDLRTVCSDLAPFDVVIAENGAVSYQPATHELKTLAEAPPPELVDRLAKRGVTDVSRGHVIVATWRPHETVVLDVIRELGLEMQVIFNKGAVMLLPSGINKGTGLGAALEILRLSPHNVVGVGDAENDHALLTACACGVAVSNALPSLKTRADLVTGGDHGAGVAELCDQLLTDDLAGLAGRLSRHDLMIGTDDQGRDVTLPAYGANVLLAGTSGGGKSTLTTAFLEELIAHAYQYFLLDPEGDHGTSPDALVLGSVQAAPTLEELTRVLDKPGQNVVAVLLGLGLDDRPGFFEQIVPQLQAQRARAGRPHWIIVDEAHHLAPESSPRPGPNWSEVTSLLLVTVHPAHVARSLLNVVDAIVVVGVAPGDTLAELASVLGAPAPDAPRTLAQGEALLWWPHRGNRVARFRAISPQTERRRHTRKYAEGDLPPERSFYFRGTKGKLNLRAHNLTAFLQIGEGVDDDTWTFHLTAGDYSSWIARVVKDEPLAEEIAALERKGKSWSAVDSRRAVKEAIERRYTAPS